MFAIRGKMRELLFELGVAWSGSSIFQSNNDPEIGVGLKAGDWFLSGWILDAFGADQREAARAPRGGVFGFHS